MQIQWALVVFTVLAGTGAALYACTMVGYLYAENRLASKTTFMLSIISAILLVVGGIASVFHLSHASRILGALSHPSSGIFMEAAGIGILLILIVVFLIVMNRSEEKASAPKILGTVGAIAAVIFLYILGASYIMSSMPAWNTPLLPGTYAVTGAVSGASLYAVLISVYKESLESRALSGKILLIVGAVSVVITALYGALFGSQFAGQSILFWMLVVVVGSLIPAIMGFLISKKPDNSMTYGIIALVCALIGIFAARIIMWISGKHLMNLHAMPRW